MVSEAISEPLNSKNSRGSTLLDPLAVMSVFTLGMHYRPDHFKPDGYDPVKVDG